MKVVVIVENVGCESCKGSHGLSMYIETKENKILFDAGPSEELFDANSSILGCDPAAADIAVLSHGHYDHSGGMLSFLRKNTKAKLYVNPLANGEYFTKLPERFSYIGIDHNIFSEYKDRIVLTGGEYKISDNLILFSDINREELLSSACKSLYAKENGEYVEDSFHHEQNLIVIEDGKAALFAGCAHRGIVNILKRAEEILGKPPEHVFSGFHLINPELGDVPNEPLTTNVAEELLKHPAMYHTGHCTGQAPYARLKELMGNRIDYMSTGKVFDI